jgi:E3 ubiquitin-protein ligase listerin
MSRRSGKGWATPSKPTAFGAFSLSSASGANLSYLSEPPNLSSVSDPNVIVSFKNLLKKDATTKSKALEDLISYAEVRPYEKEGGVEDPVLEAWVRSSGCVLSCGIRDIFSNNVHNRSNCIPAHQ